MRITLATTVIVFCLATFSGCGSGTARAPANANSLTTEEKHRLYSAALVAVESPLDNEGFKDVCRKIGIFDAAGKPNDNYIAFVSDHIDWAAKVETEKFKTEINSRDKARDYLNHHLPR